MSYSKNHYKNMIVREIYFPICLALQGFFTLLTAPAVHGPSPEKNNQSPHNAWRYLRAWKLQTDKTRSV